MNHIELGRKGENHAQEYLKTKGYKILETNWRIGRHEVDIIARDGKNLVIVEVKTRMSSEWIEPEMSVDKLKQRILIRAANIYVSKYKIDLDARFDIITLIVVKDRFRLNHIEDAFYPVLW